MVICHSKETSFGIDLAAPKGTAILAAHDGVDLCWVEIFEDSGKNGFDWKAYGLGVHLRPPKINVKTGEKEFIRANSGGMGRTGRATGVHLHFELRKKGPVDPYYIYQRPKLWYINKPQKPKFGKRLQK